MHARFDVLRPRDRRAPERLFFAALADQRGYRYQILHQPQTAFDGRKKKTGLGRNRYESFRGTDTLKVRPLH